MSMVINLVEDHNIYLCEGGPVYNGGVQPTPITYLTQWKIVGNSQVHTLPYPDGVVLPTGYKRCEYLVFDGNSYINTGIKTANDIGYNLACTNTNNNAWVLIGARLNASFNGFGLGFGYVGYGGETVLKGISYSTQKVNVLLDATQCKVGDNDYDISDIRATATTFFDIYVGTWNQNDTPDWRMWIGNIYDTIIYNTQGELWHGIPCLDANDVPCFYDIISQTAFYNDGTGTFGYKLYPQPTEIWSCGEYNPIDGKYHILVKPQGGSIADIALDEPLRKVNNVADTIEFPSGTEGKALVTRNFKQINAGSVSWSYSSFSRTYVHSTPDIFAIEDVSYVPNLIVTGFDTVSYNNVNKLDFRATARLSNTTYFIYLYSNTFTDKTEFNNYIRDKIIIYQLSTPTTELVDAPQIEEAESYTCVISQGAKAISWSEFLYTINYLLTDNKNNLLVDSENYKLTVQS